MMIVMRCSRPAGEFGPPEAVETLVRTKHQDPLAAKMEYSDQPRQAGSTVKRRARMKQTAINEAKSTRLNKL